MSTPPEVLAKVYKTMNEHLLELLHEQKTTIDLLTKESEELKEDYRKLKLEHVSAVEQLSKC
jgi:hypothetical protein